MLVFDTTSLLAGIALLIALTMPRLSKGFIPKVTASIYVTALVLHLLLEGPRWQMVAAYIVGASLSAAVFIFPSFSLKFKGQQYARLKRWSSVSFFSFSIAMSVFASALFPMFELPQPSGAYAIGFSELHMIDQTRNEAKTDEPNDFREFMVKVWYPAEAHDVDDPQPYWPNADTISTHFVKELGPLAPGFLFSHLDQIPSHSYPEANLAPASEPYPVLIFSHGLGVFAEQSTVLMEELASHGYVVFSINHTYWSMLSTFPNGRVTSFRSDSSPALEAESNHPEAMTIMEKALASSKTKEIKDLMSQMAEMAPLTIQSEINSLNTLSQDHMFVMDELEKLNTSHGLFKDRLDLSRIGLLGFSLGGKTTIQTCARDDRCKAGVNIDGFSLVSPNEKPHQQPFMHMRNDRNPFVSVVYEAAEGPSYSVHIRGTEHPNYTDFSIVAPWLFKQVGLLGEIDGYRMLELQNIYIRSFFDKHLKGEASLPLKDTIASYPEVMFLTRNENSKKYFE
ncbi:MAG: alpha/beta hydrolase family protein [Kordiimonas sp.]